MSRYSVWGIVPYHVGEDGRLREPHERLKPHLEKLKIDYTYQSLPDVGHNLDEIKNRFGKEIVLMLSKSYSKAE